MKIRKIPMRTCCVTNEKFEKRELLRIVKTKDGEIFVDETGKINGHGAYIKKDIEVLKKAKDKKILDRKLETNISDDIYMEIEKIINNK